MSTRSFAAPNQHSDALGPILSGCWKYTHVGVTLEVYGAYIGVIMGYALITAGFGDSSNRTIPTRWGFSSSGLHPVVIATDKGGWTHVYMKMAVVRERSRRSSSSSRSCGGSSKQIVVVVAAVHAVVAPVQIPVYNYSSQQP